jgi:hypothetical protein
MDEAMSRIRVDPFAFSEQQSKRSAADPSARDSRQIEALATDKLPSMGRRSEYPSDDFIDVSIETAAMAEDNTLWLP